MINIKIPHFHIRTVKYYYLKGNDIFFNIKTKNNKNIVFFNYLNIMNTNSCVSQRSGTYLGTVSHFKKEYFMYWF